jgi:hypothetical protein
MGIYDRVEVTAQRFRIDWGKALPPLQQSLRRQRLEGPGPQLGDRLSCARDSDVLTLEDTIHNVAAVIAKVANDYSAHDSMYRA